MEGLGKLGQNDLKNVNGPIYLVWSEYAPADLDLDLEVCQSVNEWVKSQSKL